jgi:capsular polysaccharide biosynthesis protein
MGIVPKANSCFTSPYVRAFSDDMVRGLGLTPRTASSCKSDPINTLFVQRVHYLAHPRHGGQIVRRLENEDDVVAALVAQALDVAAGVKIVKGTLSSMSMTQQVRLAQDACIIVGAHGAGLSHVLFAPPEVHVLELQTPGFVRPHFIGYSYWAGSHHHAWVLDTSSPQIHSVVSRVFETAMHAGVEAREPTHGHDAGHPGADGTGASHPGHNY